MSFVKSIFSFATAFVLVSTALTNRSVGQVIIGEIMVDPTGTDGTPPNSTEWIELYNPTGAPITIGCMVISDGDFALTIPSGVVLEPDSVYLIGAAVGGLLPDLNWATCNCSTPLPLTGSLSDMAEQVIVFDNMGLPISGVVWGGGNFGTPNLNSSSSGGCSAVTLSFVADPGAPITTPISIVTGQTNAIDCTGSYVNDPAPTPGTTNNGDLPVAVITSTASTICETAPGNTVNLSSAGSLGANSVSWFIPNGSTTSSGNADLANISFNAIGAQTVTLTVTNSCGLTSPPTTITIQVDQASVVNITATLDGAAFAAPYDICEDQTLVLSTAAVGTIQWTLGGADIPGANSSDYVVSQAGNYGITAVNGVCTSNSPANAVTISLTPAAGLVSTDFDACLNDSPLIIEATPGFTAAAPLNAYSWTIDGIPAGTNTTVAIPTANPAVYALELVVTDGICASAPLAFDVTVFDLPSAEITPAGPLNLCPDDEVILSSVNTHNSYQWLLNGAPISGEIGQTLNYVYSQPASASITLEAEDNGCTTETAVPVDIVEHDAATIAGWTPPPYAENNTLFTCQDEHPILAVSNGLQFQWYYNGVAIPGEIGLTITATDDGEYYYTASKDGFCEIYSDTITVDLEMSLDIETFASKDTACVGDTVLIIPDGDFVSYSWNGGVIGDTLTVTNTGIYIVTAHLVSCEITDTVSVYFSPYPVVNAGSDFYSDCEDNTLLYGATTGDSTFWELDNILLTYGDTVVIPTPTRTSDLVMISYLNECKARDTVNIKVDCVYIFAPTAITPDGDGLNDVFRVYANGLTQYTLRIFNRYGEVVFETSDPEDVWTGGFNDYYLPNGIYTWQIEALDYNQQEALSKARSRGSIVVLR
jgi:gliding motility-associated-like protein